MIFEDWHDAIAVASRQRQKLGLVRSDVDASEAATFLIAAYESIIIFNKEFSGCMGAASRAKERDPSIGVSGPAFHPFYQKPYFVGIENGIYCSQICGKRRYHEEPTTSIRLASNVRRHSNSAFAFTRNRSKEKNTHEA